MTLFFFILASTYVNAQEVLNANNPGNTYEDINAVLAPGYNAVEVPDCGHTSFGRHIDEIFDTELNSFVFRFHLHLTPDNDRCLFFDRQRTEIKTYNQSPDNLKATYGETVKYRWKFKLPANFQSSPAFTHIHQIKSVDGPFASMPMFTMTTRQNASHNLQLRYAPQDTQSTIAQVDINPFLGEWIEATEIINFDNSGSYSLELKRLSDHAILLDYTNFLDTWQDGASFARPKWGIYRSLNFAYELQDEQVFFNDFSIEENPNLSINDIVANPQKRMYLSENPSDQKVFIINADYNSYDKINIYNNLGGNIMLLSPKSDHSIDISGLDAGLYYIVLSKNNLRIAILKCIVI